MTIATEKKRIHVVAGIIWNQEKTHLLVSRRPDHLHKGGYWEFPGGKLEIGETEEAALARELYEELSIRFRRCERFQETEFDYPEKQVRLSFYHVFDVYGEICGNEQQEWRWVPLAALPDYRFPEANQSIVDALVRIV